MHTSAHVLPPLLLLLLPPPPLLTACPAPAQLTAMLHHCQWPFPPAASWDPRREGSLLGWTEFQANVPLLLDRFRRNSD